jgi:hypothetical protein
MYRENKDDIEIELISLKDRNGQADRVNYATADLDKMRFIESDREPTTVRELEQNGTGNTSKYF